MLSTERRCETNRDRRRVSRGGRRAEDRPGHFPSVLVVDSYDGVRIPCVRYLNKFGFHTEEATEGRDALAKISAARPQAVLVESGLPDAPVSEIVARLREHPQGNSIPILVMTNHFDWTVGEAGVDAGPLVGLIMKPFALSAMLQELRRLLREQPPVLAVASLSMNATL